MKSIVVITVLQFGEYRSAHDAHVCLFSLSSQAGGAPGRHLYSRSDILATDECSHAARISRVVQTSKQAARATGGETDSLSMSTFFCTQQAGYIYLYLFLKNIFV